MPIVNIHAAKTTLSRLIRLVESGEHQEVVIARDGIPVAKLVPLNHPSPITRRLGIARGMFTLPENFDRDESPSAKEIGREKTAR